MRHDLFETCIRNEDISIDFVTASAENIVCRHAENLVGCNIEESEALNELMQILPQIKSFFNAYTNIVGSQSGSILVGPTCMSTSIHLQIKGAHATEQKIVVPELGMKGIIDATLDAFVGSTHSYKASQKRTGLMPLELKTGYKQEFQVEHGAQLSLYSLMIKFRNMIWPGKNQSKSKLQEAESKAVDGGVLLYLNAKDRKDYYICPSSAEVKSLIGIRNNIADALHRASQPRAIRYFQSNNENQEDDKDPQR